MGRVGAVGAVEYRRGEQSVSINWVVAWVRSEWRFVLSVVTVVRRVEGAWVTSEGTSPKQSGEESRLCRRLP